MVRTKVDGVAALEVAPFEGRDRDHLGAKLVQGFAQALEVVGRGERGEIDIAAKLRCAVENAGLPAHQQGSNPVRAKSRKEVPGRASGPCLDDHCNVLSWPPGVEDLLLFAFVEAWKNLLWPPLVTRSREMRVVEVGIASFHGTYEVNWPYQMAAGVAALIMGSKPTASGVVVLPLPPVRARLRFGGQSGYRRARRPGGLAGDGRSAIEGDPLADSLVVRVTDRSGRPLSGVYVTWSTSGGTVSPTVVASGPGGEARAKWTLGPVPGPVDAVATVPGVVSASFTAHAVSVDDAYNDVLRELALAFAGSADEARPGVVLLAGTLADEYWVSDLLNAVGWVGLLFAGLVHVGPRLLAQRAHLGAPRHTHDADVRLPARASDALPQNVAPMVVVDPFGEQTREQRRLSCVLIRGLRR